MSFPWCHGGSVRQLRVITTTTLTDGRKPQHQSTSALTTQYLDRLDMHNEKYYFMIHYTIIRQIMSE